MCTELGRWKLAPHLHGGMLGGQLSLFVFYQLRDVRLHSASASTVILLSLLIFATCPHPMDQSLSCHACMHAREDATHVVDQVPS